MQERKDEVLSRLMALQPGGALTVVGLRHSELGQMLSEFAYVPPILQLDFQSAGTVTLAIERILDDLAELATAAWPSWDTWAEQALPPNLLQDWYLAAIKLAAEGKPPRFSRLGHEIEFLHLRSVLPRLVLLAEIDPSHAERARLVITAIEWARQHGAPVAALFPECPRYEPPWDTFLYGATVFAAPPSHPAIRRVFPLPASDAAVRGSATERRLRQALRAAPDLSELFEDEVTLQLGALGPTPRVDLLWRKGKIVVELDGPEHERDPNYAADRHRDYELLVAGYLVLRLTNAEVELDLDRSLEKVRRVVNLRRAIP